MFLKSMPQHRGRSLTPPRAPEGCFGDSFGLPGCSKGPLATPLDSPATSMDRKSAPRRRPPWSWGSLGSLCGAAHSCLEISTNHWFFLYFRKGAGVRGSSMAGPGSLEVSGCSQTLPGHLQRRYWDTWDDMGTSERSLESSQERVNASRAFSSTKRTQASPSATP